MSEKLEQLLTPQQRSMADHADRISSALIRMGTLSHYDQEQNLIAATDSAIEAAENDFLAIVASGTNSAPRSWSEVSKGSAYRYPMTDYLGECGQSAKSLLFGACHEAVKAGPPQTQGERDALALKFLRAFVQQCAKDFGADNWEAFL